MAKIRRARRIAGLAVGAVKTIFRSGKAYGTARTRVRTRSRPTPPPVTGVAAGAAAGAAGAYFLDPQNGKRRRHVARDKAMSLLHHTGEEAPAKDSEAASVHAGTA